MQGNVKIINVILLVPRFYLIIFSSAQVVQDTSYVLSELVGPISLVLLFDLKIYLVRLYILSAAHLYPVYHTVMVILVEPVIWGVEVNSLIGKYPLLLYLKHIVLVYYLVQYSRQSIYM